MSQTIRIYYREYGTGEVGLVAGCSTQAGTWPIQKRFQDEAEQYARTIEAKVQTDRDDDLHVLKTAGHRAVGRYYFWAWTPAEVPLGEGWKIIAGQGDNDGEDLIFGFETPDDALVRLTWRAMSQDEIDNQHCNDDFGGWTNPVLAIGPDTLIPLDREEGDTDAVFLMMLDADRVPEEARRLGP